MFNSVGPSYGGMGDYGTPQGCMGSYMGTPQGGMTPQGCMGTPQGGMTPQGCMGTPQGGMGSFHMTPLNAELKRIFLEISPEETRHYRVTSLLQQASPQDVAMCVPFILDRLVNYASANSIGIHMLSDILRFHTMVFAEAFPPARIYDLFNPEADDWAAAAFVHQLICWKASQGMSVNEDASKIGKLLVRRSKQQSLRQVPASALRSWLTRMWVDVPECRQDQTGVTECCVRWVGDQNASIADKIPCLAIVKGEVESRGRPAGDTWVLSKMLAQVCRDPANHSPDLQHLLWMLGSLPSASVIRPLLGLLAEEPGRLVTLWVCLCLWVPQPMPPELGMSQVPAMPPPIHALLRVMLIVFSQLLGGDEICCTCLLSIVAIAGGAGPLPVAAAELLLFLHRDGPVLAASVWKPVLPLVESLVSMCQGQSATLVELHQRLQVTCGVDASMGMNMMGGPCMGGILGGQGGMESQGYPMDMGGASYEMPDFGVNYASAPMEGYPMPMENYGGGADMYPPSGPDVQPPPDGVAVDFGPPRVGLRNTNNTCYMNSFIQSLFMTNYFVWRIFSFKLKLKKGASKMDQEDHKFGKKVVQLFQRKFGKMLLTKQPHVEIDDILKTFPPDYRSGEQQDVTETVRFVFDKLGGNEQALIREVFAGELSEKTMCSVCGFVKSRSETFTDIVLPVPTEKQVKKSGVIPTAQDLLDRRLQFENLGADNLLQCDQCQMKQQAGKWSEIMSPPMHLCIQLNRFNYDVKSMSFSKEKTPIRIDGTIRIGPYVYDLYHVILHTGKDASSGHYYSIGSRAEDYSGGPKPWVLMDDSQMKPADMSLLSGASDKKDDNPYVLFYHCQQANPTPPLFLPKTLAHDLKKEDKKECANLS